MDRPRIWTRVALARFRFVWRMGASCWPWARHDDRCGMSGPVHTTCPYCGVGCGVVAQPDETIKADTGHPSNRGRLCSKGAALGATLDDSTRLTVPMVFGQKAGWDEALQTVADRFRKTVEQHGPDSVAFYVSG